MTIENISPRLREDFVNLIAQQTGIEIRSQNYGAMGDNIHSRIRELEIPKPQGYYDFLTSATPESEEEWQKFICLTTNKESYFFRDKGQFSLIKQTILPDLIRRNQRIKSLKICSAGCSTGQEPYSIAILLKELIPDIDSWNINILGIDINRESLAQAKKGLYNTWSFRQVEDDIKQKYFASKAGYYQLSENIMRLVKFKQVNLVRDQMPDEAIDLRDMDLIICRNVFIYFTEAAITRVVEKFFNTLKHNGYLITGHAELNNNQVKAFHTKLFSESLIYQRRSGNFSLNSSSSISFEKPPTKESFSPIIPINQFSTPNSHPKEKNKNHPHWNHSQPVKNYSQKSESLINNSISTPFTSEEDILKEIEQLVTHKSYSLAQRKLEQVLQQFPQDFNATYLMAELEANLGKYDSAQEWCQKALTIDTLHIKPYFLLAQIEEEIGKIEEAKNLLKKIIYLEPEAFIAYLNLANLYQQEGDLKRSQKMRESALKILQKMPDGKRIKELNNILVEDLLLELQELSSA